MTQRNFKNIDLNPRIKIRMFLSNIQLRINTIANMQADANVPFLFNIMLLL